VLRTHIDHPSSELVNTAGTDAPARRGIELLRCGTDVVTAVMAVRHGPDAEVVPPFEVGAA